MQRYFWNILIGTTQYLNVLTGGEPDQSFSGRTGIAFLLGKKWAIPVRKIIDFIFFRIRKETNHCINAIEWDEIDIETLEKLRRLGYKDKYNGTKSN